MFVRAFVLMSLTVMAFPTLGIAAMMAFDVWHDRRKRRRFPPGVCRCGYDLRGNFSGRCPECGRASNLWPLQAD